MYLGSRRHVLPAIFDDRNEPFWRSAKQVELGRIPAEHVAPYRARALRATERAIDDDALARLLELTDGHPYATQELAYFTWGARAATVIAAHGATCEPALADVLRSEHNNLGAPLGGVATPNERLVLLALRGGPGGLYAEAYRRRHGLPAATFVQRAVEGSDRART